MCSRQLFFRFLDRTSFAADSPAKTLVPQARGVGWLAPVAGSGSAFLRSPSGCGLSGLSSRTPGTAGATGCPNCGAVCGDLAFPACRFECSPRKLAHPIAEPACFSLPTPTASRYGSGNNGDPHDGRGAYATKGKPSLDTMAARGLLPTPLARDWKGKTSANRNSRTLPDSLGGRLHPQFVEWMMGLPDGWTEPD